MCHTDDRPSWAQIELPQPKSPLPDTLSTLYRQIAAVGRIKQARGQVVINLLLNLDDFHQIVAQYPSVFRIIQCSPAELNNLLCRLIFQDSRPARAIIDTLSLTTTINTSDLLYNAITLTDGLHLLDRCIESLQDGAMKEAVIVIRDAMHLDANDELRPYTPRPNDHIYEQIDR